MLVNFLKRLLRTRYHNPVLDIAESCGVRTGTWTKAFNLSKHNMHWVTEQHFRFFTSKQVFVGFVFFFLLAPPNQTSWLRDWGASTFASQLKQKQQLKLLPWRDADTHQFIQKKVNVDEEDPEPWLWGAVGNRAPLWGGSAEGGGMVLTQSVLPGWWCGVGRGTRRSIGTVFLCLTLHRRNSCCTVPLQSAASGKGTEHHLIPP
jgi:hypothetical protein